MNKNWLLWLLLPCLIIGCQNQESKKNTVTKISQKKLVNYQSSIPYTVDANLEINVAARLNDQNIEWNQLTSADVALRDLEKTHRDQALFYAYNWALEIAPKESQEPINLTLFLSAPDDLPALFKTNNTKLDKKVNVVFQEPKDRTTLASLGSSSDLAWQTYLQNNRKFSKTYTKLFHQRMQRLNGIVIRRLLLTKAKEDNQAVEAFIRKSILPESQSISDEEIRNFALEKGISEKKLDEKMSKRIKDILLQKNRDQTIENYVAKNLVKEPIKISFAEPENKVNLSQMTVEGPRWGNKKGPNLVYVGDWSCSECRKPIGTFIKIKNDYGPQVQGQFIFGFSKNERLKRMGAEAALCVHSIDEEAFWGFMDELKEGSDKLTEAELNEAVKKQSIDFEKFQSCFLARKFKDNVEEHLKITSQLGIFRFPTLILNGKILNILGEGNDLEKKIKELIPAAQRTVSQKKSLGFFRRILAFFGFD